MKPFQPREFYATEWCWQDPVCHRRIERLMEGFGRPLNSLRVVREDELEGLIRAKSWLETWRRQGYNGFSGDPDLVFNRFRWLDSASVASLRKRYPVLQEGRDFAGSMVQALYGLAPSFHFEDGVHKRTRNQNCCWSLYDLHTGWGCLHKCKYCQRGRVMTLMLNLEEWLVKVDDLLAKAPWQKTIRYDVETDCLPVEPEYGACRMLVEHFARLPDRYLILFSKSDNVDFLLDLEHRGHTIMLWTLSTSTVSRRIEVDTATTAQRIEAARKCQQAGYPVRFKLKPIIPVKNWREEATRMFEQLFAAVRPDNLSMEMLFFRSVEELKAMFGGELDPDFVRLMERAQASGQPWEEYRPVPEDFRVEVYEFYAAAVRRLSPGTPLSLCAESPTVWARLAPLLGQAADDFICNCGPACVPNLRPGAMAARQDWVQEVAGRDVAASPRP